MSTPIRTHRELLIWRRGMTLVDAVDEVAKRVPEQERTMLADQLVRATRPVPTNIAEGHGRFTPGDFARFLTIARRRGYLEQAEWAALNEATHELARMIRAFRAALRRR